MQRRQGTTRKTSCFWPAFEFDIGRCWGICDNKRNWWGNWWRNSSGKQQTSISWFHKSTLAALWPLIFFSVLQCLKAWMVIIVDVEENNGNAFRARRWSNFSITTSTDRIVEMKQWCISIPLDFYLHSHTLLLFLYRFWVSEKSRQFYNICRGWRTTDNYFKHSHMKFIHELSLGEGLPFKLFRSEAAMT